MTVQELPPGHLEPRKYACGHSYTPVPLEARKHRIRKPADPRAVRFGGSWFLPLDLLPDAERAMPATRPDEETLEHRALCQCEVCQRPQAAVLWRRRRWRERRSDRSAG